VNASEHHIRPWKGRSFVCACGASPIGTNGRSKSLKHHKAMQALFIAWYNFGRKNEALKVQTPAMASQLTDHVWSIKQLIEKAAEA
jgi:hypothetical protein